MSDRFQAHPGLAEAMKTVSLWLIEPKPITEKGQRRMKALGILHAAMLSDGRPIYGEVFSPTHLHRKRGTEYQVIAPKALVQVGFEGLVDGDEVVVYLDSEGRWWVRPPSEFHDGRFVALEVSR